MRLYKIKHNITGKILSELSRKRLRAEKQMIYTVVWDDDISDLFVEISKINYLIEDLVRHGLHASLDNTTLVTAEYKLSLVAGNINIATVRRRIEQKIIIERLRE